ncbi:MAG: hypothetical protein WC767_02080 [Candidatus Paceibacterota bacterium]|jgi:hypothetical protein
MSHLIEAYTPSSKTKKLAQTYVRLLDLPEKTAEVLGKLTRILVETALPEYDLIRIGRHQQLHT